MKSAIVLIGSALVVGGYGALIYAAFLVHLAVGWAALGFGSLMLARALAHALEEGK